MVHTRDLRYFLAVAQHLHMTRAAASVFVTQPALSKQIASLERGLGATLFDRHHDGVSLTVAGEAFLPFARQIVELDEQAVAEVHRVMRSARKITVGFWLSPAKEVLSEAVSTFTREHPTHRLRLRRAEWSEPGAGVVSGQADVAFVETPHDRPVEGLRSHRLSVETLVVAVQVGHRLSSMDSVGLSDLLNETLFVLPKEAGQLGARAGFASSGAAVPTFEYVTTIDETIEGVATGLGVCIVTPSVIRAHPHSGMTSVPIRNSDTADYWVVWREEDEQRAEIQGIVHALTAAHGQWFGSQA